MKRLNTVQSVFIVLFSTIGLIVIFFFLNQYRLRTLIDEAQVDHFNYWKEREFYPNGYFATVFDIEYNENGDVVYLKMKKIDNEKYINEGYICLTTHLKLKDTIYKKRNSYDLFKIDNLDTLKLNYYLCGKGSE